MSLEVSSSLSRHKYHSVYSQCFLSWFFETTKNTKLSLFDVCVVLPTKVFKGQLISKCLLGIFNSSKKRTKKVGLATIQWYLKSICFHSFFGRIEDTKKTFRNYLTFSKGCKFINYSGMLFKNACIVFWKSIRTYQKLHWLFWQNF